MVTDQMEIVKNRIQIEELTKPISIYVSMEKNYNKEQLIIIWMFGYLHCPVNNELTLTKHSW